ncbi:hypothetical protein B0J14DRAFT_577457 [Halenospora varia]|nr:hypothetical protein B0J14DRAFT_577457 [Halenospora varia]
MPDGVTIPKTNIKTTTATTTSSSRSSTLTLLPETFMTDFFNPYPTPADTDAASAMATALQARFVSLEAAATTSSSTNCVCTQIVASDGTKGNLYCPTSQDGLDLDCSMVTSTQAPAPPPTKTPLPNPAPPATCNHGRPLPDYAEDITFNRDAAKSAITMFCHDNPYSYAKNAIQTCPSWQSYAFEGSKVNSGGQTGVLGPVTRIYLAMRWDLVDCTNNDWWSVNNEQNSPAGKYLDGPTLYDDCVAGFNAALGGCETPGDTHGAKDTYKCMEYFLFPSTSSNLVLPCNNLPW